MMELSDNLRQVVTDELRYVAERIREEKDSARKNYFFSAAYAVVYRGFNLEFDPGLVLVHDVLQRTYRNIDTRLTAIGSGQERAIKVPEGLFDRLAKHLDELSNAIYNNKDINEPLSKIAVISYVTTGNGYYLYKKGILKI